MSPQSRIWNHVLTGIGMETLYTFFRRVRHDLGGGVQLWCLSMQFFVIFEIYLVQLLLVVVVFLDYFM